jgi:hypothetical protein
MAGIVAAGALGAALAVGGAAYAAGDQGTGNGEQIVRVVDSEGTDGRDCPDKGAGGSGESGETGDNL